MSSQPRTSTSSGFSRSFVAKEVLRSLPKHACTAAGEQSTNLKTSLKNGLVLPWTRAVSATIQGTDTALACHCLLLIMRLMACIYCYDIIHSCHYPAQALTTKVEHNVTFQHKHDLGHVRHTSLLSAALSGVTFIKGH